MAAHKCNNRYTNGIAICHGKSEVSLSKYITTNLHLCVKTYSKENGKKSIQINGLMSLLNGNPFKNPTSFLKEYGVETQGKGRDIVLKDFKLFIIMDTDDCSEVARNDFISGKMFLNHWLSDYIVPIYNTPSLEDVMLEAGIMTKRIKDTEKGEFYSKVFPINQNRFSEGTIDEIKLFKNKIQKCRKSNLLQFVDYCLLLVSK